jgi:hypothetical protein
MAAATNIHLSAKLVVIDIQRSIEHITVLPEIERKGKCSDNIDIGVLEMI